MEIHCWICKFRSCGGIMWRAMIDISQHILGKTDYWIVHRISWSRQIDWIILAQTHTDRHTMTKSHSFVHNNIIFRNIIVFHLSRVFITAFIVFETAIYNLENIIDVTFVAFLLIIIWIPNIGSYDILIMLQL